MIEYTRYSQHQDGPRITKHTFQQSEIKMPLHLEKVGDEEERDESCTPEVDAEHIKDLRLSQHHKIKHIQCDIEEDEQHLQRGKLNRSLLESQITERHRLNGVEHHDSRHHQQIVGVVRIAKHITDRGDETKDECQEKSGKRTHHTHRCGEHGIGRLILLVGKAEERRLHTKGKDNQHKGCVSVDVHTHPIIARFLRHVIRIKWHEQVIEKPAHNATHTIDSRILC